MPHTEEQTPLQTAETAENDSARQNYIQFLKKIWDHPFVSEEAQKRREVACQLEKDVREKCAQPFSIHLIGSSLIGTAHAQSDIDICFALPAGTPPSEYHSIWQEFKNGHRALHDESPSVFLRSLGFDPHYLCATTEHIDFAKLRKSLRTNTKRRRYSSTISDRSLLLDRVGLTVFLPALNEFNSPVVYEQVMQFRRERFAVAETLAQQLDFNPEQFWNLILREVLQHTCVYPGDTTGENATRFMRQQKHLTAHIEQRAQQVPEEKRSAFQARAARYVAQAQEAAIFPDYQTMRRALSVE